MHHRSNTPDSGQSSSGSHKKRSDHRKVRTGCKTCKMRRIRCDELKPACRRCLTSGRNCEGYATSLAQPLPGSRQETPADPCTELVLLPANRSPEELRSYRFFTEVTAPSLASTLFSDFWLHDIPRLCQSDPAIWHAIVCLGSTSEFHVSGQYVDPGENVFALTQFNKSIRELVKAEWPAHWWRALVVSTIFTGICMLQRQYAQGLMHFRSGLKLLREYDKSGMSADLGSSSSAVAAVPGRDPEEEKDSARPISVASLRSVLLDIEMRDNKFRAARSSNLPTMLSTKSRHDRWRSYVAPASPLRSGSIPTADQISQALEASESLFLGLAFSSSFRTRELQSLYAGGEKPEIIDIGPDQRPLAHCYRELGRAIKIFGDALQPYMRSRVRTNKRVQLNKAMLLLRLMHATGRIMFRRDPDDPTLTRHHNDLPATQLAIVDFAEEIMSLDKNLGCLRSGGDFPSPTVINPLFVVAKTGFDLTVRKRAIEILQRPRLEGMWDSIVGARVAEAMLDRETAMNVEYSLRGEDDTIIIDDFTSRGWEMEMECGSEIHPLARICNYSMLQNEGEKLKLEIRTWLEWLRKEPGYQVVVDYQTGSRVAMALDDGTDTLFSR